MRVSWLQSILLCCLSLSIVSCSGNSPSSGGNTKVTEAGTTGPEERKEGSKFVEAAYNLRSANKVPEALIEINKAVAIDKNNYYAWQLRADINHVLNKTEDAIEDMKKAVALKPDQAALFYTKAKYEGDVRDYASALEDAKQAVKLEPNNNDYLYMRGSGYAIAQDYKKAIADATAVINADPKNQSAYKLRAVCYFKTGDKKKSAADEKMFQKLSAAGARFIPVKMQ